jgi:hypothetical protein
MSPAAYSPKFSELLRDWLIDLGIILISFFGVILSLICIYALPDKTVRPLTGAIFYIIGAMVVGSSFFLWRRKETAAALSTGNGGSKTIPVKKPASKIILEWIVGVYLFYYVINGLIIALLCICALPDTNNTT